MPYSYTFYLASYFCSNTYLSCINVQWTLQNAVFGVLFLLGLLAGGAASAANVADVQDFLDTISFACDNPPNELVTEICDNWEQLRNSIAAAAVSFSTL